MSRKGGDSSSTTSNTTNNTTNYYDDHALTDLANGDGYLSNVGLTNVNTGGASVGVSVTQTGVSGAEIGDFLNRFQATVQGLLTSVGDIAKSATGTESETGRLANKVALPAIVLAGVLVLAWWWRRR